MSQERPVFTEHLLVHGDLINGTLVMKDTFHLKQILGKNLSIGYHGGFNKEKLGKLINELQDVYDKMEEKES
jgi:hypothetical protein